MEITRMATRVRSFSRLPAVLGVSRMISASHKVGTKFWCESVSSQAVPRPLAFKSFYILLILVPFRIISATHQQKKCIRFWAALEVRSGILL